MTRLVQFIASKDVSMPSYVLKLFLLTTERSKAWVCGRSLAGTAGSNPARGMDVCLLWVVCVVR